MAMYILVRYPKWAFGAALLSLCLVGFIQWTFFDEVILMDLGSHALMLFVVSVMKLMCVLSAGL